MPLSDDLARRLLPLLPEAVARHGTPFHVYDARGIVATHRALEAAFAGTPFRQHFAVKALPNPHVLALLGDAGSGLDCSSTTELTLAGRVGVTGDRVVFTSNNTSLEEYHHALDLGALVTFDDRTLLERVDVLPDVVAFRVSPHGLAARSTLMGDAAHSKFGVPVDALADAYRAARHRGATRFGIHGMTCANELDTDRAIAAAVGVVEMGARMARDAGIDLEHVNIGGGLGIPYRPEDRPLDLDRYGAAVADARRRLFGPDGPTILTELGRCVTGPHGVLVTRVVTRARKGHEIVGLDASMSSLMRPAMYGAYHHVSLPFAGDRPEVLIDVVGSLCENMDKFALDRPLPDPREGDIALVHDTGAHGHAMGFTYNGRLRPAELLLTDDDQLVEIRRAETFDDYVATVRWDPVPVAGAVPEPALAHGTPRSVT